MGVYIYQSGTEKEMKNAYIGEVLVLQQIFDFSTNDLHGFTNTTNAGPGIEINTTGGYCTGIYNATQTGNGMIWKEINARKFRGRIKFGFNRVVKGEAIVGAQRAKSTITNPKSGGYMSYNSVGIGLFNTETTVLTSSQYTPSLSSQYYIDTMFENGLYTVILYDDSLNELKKITYQSSDTVFKYSGFSLAGGDAGYSTIRIYEYWEAYKV